MTGYNKPTINKQTNNTKKEKKRINFQNYFLFVLKNVLSSINPKPKNMAVSFHPTGG